MATFRLKKGQVDPNNPQATSIRGAVKPNHVDINKVSFDEVKAFASNNPVVSADRISQVLGEPVLYDTESTPGSYGFHTEVEPLLHIEQYNASIDRYNVWTVGENSFASTNRIVNTEGVEGHFSVEDIEFDKLPEAVRKLRETVKRFIAKL